MEGLNRLEAETKPVTMEEQLNQLQQLMKLQMEMSLRSSTATMNSHEIKHVKAPEGRYDMKSGEFRIYSKDCRDFKKLTNHSDEQVVIQMRLNMDEELKRAIDTNFGEDWNGLKLEEALSSIKELIKCTSNPAIYRKEFDNLCQKNGENVREFVTRLKSCAMDCEFLCPFDENHDLTEYHIINRIRCGILDKQLQQELLQKAKDLKDLNNVLVYCESFESSKLDRDRLRSNDSNVEVSGIDTQELSKEEMIAAISTYKKSKQFNGNKCPACGYEKHDKSKCPAQGKKCSKCNKMNHFAAVCRSKGNSKKETSAESSAVIISSIQCIDEQMIAGITKLPCIDISIGIKEENMIKMNAIADTGAQVCVAGIDQMHQLGLHQNQLKASVQDLKHVGGNKLNVLGSHTTHIHYNDTTLKAEIYFVQGIQNVYLSLNVCKMLHIIPENFPFAIAQPSQISATFEDDHNLTESSPNDCMTNNKMEYEPSSDANDSIPMRPEKPPFEPTEDNVPLLQEWLLNQFSKTAFNVNADYLPVMKGKPHKIHLKKDAIPYAAHTPIPIPHHWKDEVKSQLDRDEKMGIIRKAPLGEGSEWCMRMVTVPKSNGTPRRTIDFQPINKHCLREAHVTSTPFNAVNATPKKMYKTVLDAYNGYHQVALDKDSVKLTTFITEFGRYQYLRAPQGHIASGDGYIRRFDDIISGVERKQKVVDDVLLYSETIEEEFYHTFDFLALCAKNGVTFAPDKFKFGQREIEFVGFNVGWENYRPSDSTMHAIENFPMPDEPSLADIRSFYGLVNQIAPFIATSSLMEPFRELLKSSRANGNKVYWDDELQKIFQETKLRLCNLITEGLTFFDVKRKTAVVTDWSKTGIGFVILQKHCKCEDKSASSLCCLRGWRPVFCNSRHMDTKEQNYRPIEGEALAVEWALRKGKSFLLGNTDFDIVTDHKPLLKIFGDKPLDEVENPVLQKFKERIMPFSYQMRYIKGIKNHANVLSRYPSVMPNQDDCSLSNEIASLMIASIDSETEDIAITMEEIIEKGSKDEQYMLLSRTINESSFAENKSEEIPLLKEFHSVRDRLSVTDKVITYGFEGNQTRIFIPKSLRKKVITNLHSANQGSTSMLARARQTVYWPGIDNDINLHCESCLQCRKNAPSKPKEPMIPSEVPEYPFQEVVTDMFELNGYWYLVYVDRLTGFPELAYFPNHTTSALIINVLREFFTRWGVPEQVSMDGASNYTSEKITDWLKSWGVKYTRVSSAYYPQSNGRAEVGVKSLKRLLEGNTGPRGSISNDKIAKALMQYRNTPHRDCRKSPAELALGRCIRDTLPLPQHRYKIDPNWARNLNDRELSMSKQNQIIKQSYDEGAKSLKPLIIGDTVLCQNVRTKKWDKSGIIVEVKGFRQYLIKMDGSGRVSLRNRRHLQKLSTGNVGILTTKEQVTSRKADTEEMIEIQDHTSDINENINESNIEGPQAHSHTLEPAKADQFNKPDTLRRSTRTHKPVVRYIEEY